MTLLFILFAAFVGWSAYNLYRPIYRQPKLVTISFLSGWLIGELALHHILWQAIVVGLFVWAGAVSGFFAALALLLCFAAWMAMLWFYIGGERAKTTVEASLRDGLGEDYPLRIQSVFRDRFPATPDYDKIKRPIRLIDPQIEVTKNQHYGNHGQSLDIYRAKHSPDNCPVLLQIHGGAWTEKMGSKNEQALPLINHMALRGWICVSIDYRLAPTATFPEPIIDCKEALVWVKQKIRDFGGDPNFIVVTGGSAGGHLAALLALTANNPTFQPGFEDADTTVQGAVPFYGAFDFTDSQGLQRNDLLISTLEKSIMKIPLEGNQEEFEEVSPLFNIHAEAPAFYVIHGSKDSLVPVRESRHFVSKLKEVSQQPVVYSEIRDAQHAFDMFPSIRSEHVKHGVEKFLSWLYSRHLDHS